MSIREHDLNHDILLEPQAIYSNTIKLYTVEVLKQCSNLKLISHQQNNNGCYNADIHVLSHILFHCLPIPLLSPVQTHTLVEQAGLCWTHHALQIC